MLDETHSENSSNGGESAPAAEQARLIAEFEETFRWKLGEEVRSSELGPRFEKLRRQITAGIDRKTPDDRLSRAILVYSYASRRLLDEYATLNFKHAQRIFEVIQIISEYVADDSLGRPLTFLLLATPGSGKSQLVRSIGQRITKANVDYASFNMATMQAKDDLARVIDAARNIVVDRKLPLIFLDEFDSRDAHYPLLLPLLWDGQLDVLNRDLRLGRSIFFLAGSRPTLPTKLNHAHEMSNAKGSVQDDDKLIDLFSRINGGVIEVPSLFDSDAIPDKVVIAMERLRRRFGACDRVPRSLLWFIAKAQFRYETRSIATLINSIRVGPKGLTLTALTPDHLKTLPFNSSKELRGSSLAFHLVNSDHADGLIELWHDAKERTGEQVIRNKTELEGVPLDSDHWAFTAGSILFKDGALPDV